MLQERSAVGVVLSAVVVALVICLSGCQRSEPVARDSELLRLESHRIRLEQEITLNQLRLGGCVVSENMDLEEEALARNLLVVSRLAARAERLRGEIEDLSKSLAETRSAWIGQQREAALGRSFDKFSGLDGRTYEDVVITRVTDIGIEFRHATGTTRLAADDLSGEQRAAFGLDAESASVALADERAAASAYEAWVDKKVAQAAAREEVRVAELDVRKPLLVASARTERSSLRDKPRPFGTGSVWSFRYSRTPRYYHYFTRSVPCVSSVAPLYQSPCSGFQRPPLSGVAMDAPSLRVCPPTSNSPHFTVTP